ncbi:RNB domain-containing ribonuclease [Escherichia coli]
MKNAAGSQLESEEAKFIFNAERRIERIEQTQRNDAHKLIEECMILANMAARLFPKRKNRHCSVFTTSRAPKQLPLSVQCWRSWGWNCRAVTSRNRVTTRRC